MMADEFVKGFFKGFKEFGLNMSTIINSVLLLSVYFIAVGMTSLVAKAFGKHFLETMAEKDKKSYWSDLNLKKKPINDYYRQF